MDDVPLLRAERFRRKANALRHIASDLRSSTSRALVLSLAADYEMLAANAEAADALEAVDEAFGPASDRETPHA